MNTIVTSREAILKTSRELFFQDGYDSLNIRKIAMESGISIGTIYNYFDSKAELLNATIESIWYEIFCPMNHLEDNVSLKEVIASFYACFEYGNKKYPGFIALHSIGFMDKEKVEAKNRMYQLMETMIHKLIHALEQDPCLRKDAFDTIFTSHKFAHVIFSIILADALQKKYDYEIVLEVIKRTLYESCL